MTTTPYEFALPWDASGDEDSRFKRILKRLLLLLLLLAVVFPWLPLPEIEREEKERVPPSLAKVLIEQRKVAPPPPPPEPVKQEEKTETVEKKAAPEPAPAKEVKKAREKVSKMGVAAFSKELSSLRSSLDVAKLQAQNTNVKTGAAAKAARSVLGATSATKTSGGVNSSVMNDSGSGTQLAAHSSTSVDSPIGSGTGGGGSSSGGGSHRSSVDGGRDMESIRRVFEQHKGAIYALYNRALRSDPGLMGKFVFHIVIEPDGSISSINLVDSQLEDQKLELKLLARIQMISFGPEDVAATPVNYKFDFMPG